MKQLCLSVILLLMACASARAQTPGAGDRANPASTFGDCTRGNSIIVANNCSGATLGLKVNAADAALGNNPGEIWVYGGGAFGDENSRITISSNHILRLFPGIYTSTGTFGYILLKDDSALICQDPSNTILKEPTHAFTKKTDLWGIVKAFGQSQGPPGSEKNLAARTRILLLRVVVLRARDLISMRARTLWKWGTVTTVK